MVTVIRRWPGRKLSVSRPTALVTEQLLPLRLSNPDTLKGLSKPRSHHALRATQIALSGALNGNLMSPKSTSESVEVFSNGVDGSTGSYLQNSMTLEQFARATRGVALDPFELRTLRSRLDPRDLADAGWGVVFPDGGASALREALAPLLDHRRSQAASLDERRFRELKYLPGETKLKFLARHGAGPGPVDPCRVPFYLLIAGEPEHIPFNLQHGLGVQYAVGRLTFDRLEDYRSYAENVVATETGLPTRQKNAVVFGVQNDDDSATVRSIRHLVDPLTRELSESCPGWSLKPVLRRRATKQRLACLLHEKEPPALLFTAGHAVTFASGKPRQRPDQGALLCADWPGPRAWRGRISEDHYFAADDLATSAHLQGLVSFHFACFSAGTPRHDSFPQELGRGGGEIAPQDFVARLPQRLLGQGASAVVGHIDRAWDQSFHWAGASQVQVLPALFPISWTATRSVWRCATSANAMRNSLPIFCTQGPTAVARLSRTPNRCVCGRLAVTPVGTWY